MNLKEQLRVQVELQERLEEGKIKEEQNNLIRSPKDWEVIEKYLEKLLNELAFSRPLTIIGWMRKQFIKIDCTSMCMEWPVDNNKERIQLNDGSNLEINHVDIKRFCKQHKLKLKYVLDKEHDYQISKRYIDDITFSYLIGI